MGGRTRSIRKIHKDWGGELALWGEKPSGGGRRFRCDGRWEKETATKMGKVDKQFFSDAGYVKGKVRTTAIRLVSREGR